jgi:hypothetical protein
MAMLAMGNQPIACGKLLRHRNRPCAYGPNWIKLNLLPIGNFTRNLPGRHLTCD